ncbi:MAG TPA: hypothetical protein VFW66_00035 [Gemmatimonadales bacterium]|nr:hypothetical protein [Gemmatimonadales bacterium]
MLDGLRRRLARLGDDAVATERELAAERARLEETERRGRLAAAIGDSETIAIAERFAARYRERIGLLERKVAVQRDELSLMARELAEARAAAPDEGRRTDARRAATEHDEADRAHFEFDRRRLEQAVEQQLAHLKRKLGKE